MAEEKLQKWAVTWECETYEFKGSEDYAVGVTVGVVSAFLRYKDPSDLKFTSEVPVVTSDDVHTIVPEIYRKYVNGPLWGANADRKKIDADVISGFRYGWIAAVDRKQNVRKT